MQVLNGSGQPLVQSLISDSPLSFTVYNNSLVNCQGNVYIISTKGAIIFKL